MVLTSCQDSKQSHHEVRLHTEYVAVKAQFNYTQHLHEDHAKSVLSIKATAEKKEDEEIEAELEVGIESSPMP